MKTKWRLIVHGALQPSWNMAVDSALLHCTVEQPVLRLYRWQKPAITIGYFQDIEKEVNSELCRNDDVSIIRRITGGGAVFHHEEITYSIVHPLQGPFAKGIMDSYALLARPFVTALNAMGVTAQYSPINDIVVAGKKISGSAQTRKEGKLLQHGTILVATDTEKMFSYLTIDPKKVKQEGKPVITLSEIVKDLTKERIYEQLIQAIINSFKEIFDIEFEEADITQQEKSVAFDFEQKYFSNEQWNCRRLSP